MVTKLKFIFVGKTKEPFIEMGIDQYRRRLEHYVPTEIKIVRGEKIGSKADTQKIIGVESRNILAKISPAAYRIALDSKGRQLSSLKLAQLLSQLEELGKKEIVFIIGGPLGLSSALIDNCPYILSLSRLTLTHEMCRLLLLEQIYRAYTIKAGEKYHK